MVVSKVIRIHAVAISCGLKVCQTHGLRKWYRETLTVISLLLFRIIHTWILVIITVKYQPWVNFLHQYWRLMWCLCILYYYHEPRFSFLCLVPMKKNWRSLNPTNRKVAKLMSKIINPENERMSPKKGHFERKGKSLPTTIFQGQTVSFRGCRCICLAWGSVLLEQASGCWTERRELCVSSVIRMVFHSKKLDQPSSKGNAMRFG